jgi:hypothetical protein
VYRFHLAGSRTRADRFNTLKKSFAGP